MEHLIFKRKSEITSSDGLNIAYASSLRSDQTSQNASMDKRDDTVFLFNQSSKIHDTI